MKTAPLSFVLLAACLGCNAILGIDEARLDPSDASSDAPITVTPGDDANSTTDDAPAGCSLEATDPCNTCISQNCCGEFEACTSDSSCRAGLIQYAFCLGNNFTSDAGVTCDEEFLSSADTLSGNLAVCAFIDNCQVECKDKTIGDLCFTYCNCMENVCGDFAFDAGSCAEACSTFDPNQLVCRPYHCNLATQNMTDETKRKLHCGHASGNPPCH